jgi:hypothetical protein
MLLPACQSPAFPQSCTTQIDWVNFVQVQSTQYVAGPGTPLILQESELGAVYMRVKAKLSGHICDPGYRPKDGDAAFLDPGTPVYQLNGYPPAERLAAHFNGQLVLYTPVGPSAIPASAPPSTPT